MIVNTSAEVVRVALNDVMHETKILGDKLAFKLSAVEGISFCSEKSYHVTTESLDIFHIRPSQSVVITLSRNNKSDQTFPIKLWRFRASNCYPQEGDNQRNVPGLSIFSIKDKHFSHLVVSLLPRPKFFFFFLFWNVALELTSNYL